MQKIFTVIAFLLVSFSTCLSNPFNNDTSSFYITTDKAVYKPGEKVSFTIKDFDQNLHARYYHLNDILKEEILTAATWTWQPPAKDMTGYLVEIYSRVGDKVKTLASIAVDVSSNWSKFPRYGFLSHYEQKITAETDAVINNLSRHHINGLQFYDWMDKHHQPLAGTPANPAASWKDIANRDTYKRTIDAYIEKAHQKGMMAMFYNLCYGALTNAETDGVKSEWYMYRDAQHNKRDLFDLPQPLFKSDIYFVDPANKEWQQFLSTKNKNVYSVYNFDGFHIDQVGSRDGKLYKNNGDSIDLTAGFHSFIKAMKATNPSKKLVFNAVNQYGQKGNIATAPVDFLYSELWTGNEGYQDLAKVIRNNYNYGGGKATILAAYMDYNKASSPGTFNTPGVLLTNAIIFAFGGSHLELGEHMLCKEYFPNNNLTMDGDLKEAITVYYDFLTGYENLLRDGGDFNEVAVNNTNRKMSIASWPPQAGKVSVQGKIVGAKLVLHFINFTNANAMDWRDTDGTQAEPKIISATDLEVAFTGHAKKVWVASPDANYGVSQQLPFTQIGSTIKFTLPELKYWDMVVIE